MKKYATIINEETNECSVGLGTDSEYYKSIGMTEMDVEQAYDGNWYLEGFAPERTPLTYAEQRLAEYPPLGEQLDMIYWDKINNTNLWLDKITEIKNKYPKV